LVAHLDDDSPTGWSSWDHELRVCDASAKALAASLGVADKFRVEGDAAERDLAIAALREYYQAMAKSMEIGR